MIMNLISEENYEFNDIVLHKYSYIYMCQWLEIKKYNAQCERFLKNWKNCQTDPR